jgi:hypothetical protein
MPHLHHFMIFGALTVSSLVSCKSGPIRSLHSTCEECTFDWDIDEMIEPALYKDSSDRSFRRADILAWDVSLLDSMLLVESALVWMHMTSSNGREEWQIIHVYRHPYLHDDNKWNLSVIIDMWVPTTVAFSARPTSAEVKKFIKDTWWGPAKRLPRDIIISRNICSKCWKELTGENYAS